MRSSKTHHKNRNHNTEKDIYKMHKVCECIHCQHRNKIEKGSQNCVTVTTKDINKLPEALSFLFSWTCGSTEIQHMSYFDF